MDASVVLIDNFDSFTYNLVQSFELCGARTEVVRNTATLDEVIAPGPTHLVLSPGPGTVEDPSSYGVSLAALAHFAPLVPVLGVCLGHQAIGRHLGAKVTQLDRVRHGHVSGVRLRAPSRLLAGLPDGFRVMRYHSLVLEETSLPDTLRVTAVAEDDGSVMAVEHTDLPVFGVQFHPESIGTADGLQIIANFLSEIPPRRDHG